MSAYTQAMAYDEAQALAADAAAGEQKTTHPHAGSQSPGGGEMKRSQSASKDDAKRKNFARSLYLGKKDTYLQDSAPAGHDDLVEAMFSLRAFNDKHPIETNLPAKEWERRFGAEHKKLVDKVKAAHQTLLDTKDPNVKREKKNMFSSNKRFVRNNKGEWLQLGSSSDWLSGKPQKNRTGTAVVSAVHERANNPRTAWWKGGRRTRRRRRKHKRKTRHRRKRRTRKRHRKHKKHKKHKRRRRTRR